MQAQLQQAIAATREAGALTLQYFGGPLEVAYKDRNDPLTAADLQADAYLKKALRDLRPDCGWLSEETVDDRQRLAKEAVWIVDPIDGTREFVEGIPEYVVAVALVEGGAPTLAVIYNPAQEQIFAAVSGSGTFHNGQRVFCSEVQSLGQATAVVSRSETKRGGIDHFRPHLGAIRPVGSVAYKLALVAAGACDLNFSIQDKNEWDVCAGDLLVREAGGLMHTCGHQVRTYNQADTLIPGGLAAGNATLVSHILHLMHEQKQ
ncbi:MAG: 3'(2'),5'-bisphosphate nucleotidase CysQ [Gemmatimonadetes bacterium]|nr:3'(2'),5'-bisphosphate nucleotidase CysQ [Gemmatimonadota bacterium]